MGAFIFKTEPTDYAWDDLVRDGQTAWDGITNPTSLKHLRSARPGDEAYIYHTGSEKRIVGLARIISDPYPDPARPDLTKAGEVKFPLVDIEPVRAIERGPTLADFRNDPRFEGFALLREPRLSVVPVAGPMLRALRAMTRP